MSPNIKINPHNWHFLLGLLGLLLSFWLCACGGEDRTSIKKYYFPVADLERGLVYEYHAVNNDSLGPDYWFYKTLQTDTALYLTGTNYGPAFDIQQLFSEKIVTNGSLIKDYFLYDTDSTGQAQRYDAEIFSGNAFPFLIRDTLGIFLSKLKWTFSTRPIHTTTLIRNRRYIGEASYPFKGKPQKCVVFENKELIDDQRDGHLEQQYSGVEYYAQDLGLVYYRKEIGDNFVLEYELADTISMKELEKRFLNFN